MPNVSAQNKIMKKAKIKNEFEREIRKNNRKLQKVICNMWKKQWVGEYPENKPIKISIKLKNNNYGDIVAVENEKNKTTFHEKSHKSHKQWK